MKTKIALSIAAIISIVIGATIETGNETPIDINDVEIDLEKAIHFRDGGRGYFVHVRTVDGGSATRIIQSPRCVRRLPDSGVNSCRMVLSDGGIVSTGHWNRFSADASTGTRCQPVACSVYFGDSADKEEYDP